MVAGGWTITEDFKNYPVCDLPQDAASAFSEVMKNWDGAKYEPLMYLAAQVVSGTNHMILCRETLVDREQTVKAATVIIYAPVSGEPQILAINPIV